MKVLLRLSDLAATASGSTTRLPLRTTHTPFSMGSLLSCPLICANSICGQRAGILPNASGRDSRDFDAQLLSFYQCKRLPTDGANNVRIAILGIHV